MPSHSAGSVSGLSCRTVFLSDLHLGARASRPGQVLDFLRGIEAQTIYLVGDIFDLWHGGRVHWDTGHDAVISELRARAESGVRVVYLPGNHDDAMRAPGAAIAGWELREAVVHEAANGRRYLVLHGDQCDPRILRWHFMTRLGSRIDGSLRQFDDWIRRRVELSEGERSLIQRSIAAANRLMAMGDRFERRLIRLAQAAGTGGVICGHSHKPVLRRRDGMTYANCGDWIDSLTALIEDTDGTLRLVQQSLAPVPVRGAAAAGLPLPKPAVAPMPAAARKAGEEVLARGLAG